MSYRDNEILAARFESAVRQAFIRVYGRPVDPTTAWRSILSSFLPKGARLEWWKPPDPLVVLILTEFAWIDDPFVSKLDYSRWQKVSGILTQEGWKDAGWDSINAGVQIVYAKGYEGGHSLGSSGKGNEYPVARLILDTRSYGPAHCPVCDADIEDVFLMTDGKIVCPDCRTPVPAFEEFSSYIHSVVPATAREQEKYRRFSRQEP